MDILPEGPSIFSDIEAAFGVNLKSEIAGLIQRKEIINQATALNHIQILLVQKGLPFGTTAVPLT